MFSRNQCSTDTTALVRRGNGWRRIICGNAETGVSSVQYPADDAVRQIRDFPSSMIDRCDSAGNRNHVALYALRAAGRHLLTRSNTACICFADTCTTSKGRLSKFEGLAEVWPY